MSEVWRAVMKTSVAVMSGETKTDFDLSDLTGLRDMCICTVFVFVCVCVYTTQKKVEREHSVTVRVANCVQMFLHYLHIPITCDWN